jgi:ribosome-associated protein
MDKLLVKAIESLEEKKARDLVVLDVKGICSFSDYIVICTATSDRQIRSIAENVKDKIGRPFIAEGIDLCRWVLLDYTDVVIHIFLEDLRKYYDLEGMWMDAKRIKG